MAKEHPGLARIADPLSDVTRKERRTLLAVSVLAIVLVHTGLIPERVSALGIDFARPQQQALLIVVALVLSYLLVAFMAYAISDFTAWRLRFHEANLQHKTEEYERDLLGDPSYGNRIDEEVDRYRGELAQRVRRAARYTGPIGLLRALIDFALPPIVALYGILALLWASWGT